MKKLLLISIAAVLIVSTALAAWNDITIRGKASKGNIPSFTGNGSQIADSGSSTNDIITEAFTRATNSVAVTPVASVTFTNGWAISCTSTSLVFVAP
jgi:hypothetical protein